jgi:hypothetical protein
MTWKLNDLELPVPPFSVEQRITRASQPLTLFMDIPIPFTTGIDEMHLLLRGYIWGRDKAYQLLEMLKNPKIQQITIQEDTGLFSGEYSVGGGSVFQTTDAIFVGSEQVFTYEIDLVVYGGKGIVVDTSTADTIKDEESVGDLFPKDWESFEEGKD